MGPATWEHAGAGFDLHLKVCGRSRLRAGGPRDRAGCRCHSWGGPGPGAGGGWRQESCRPSAPGSPVASRSELVLLAPRGGPANGGGSCAVGSVCSLWPHPSSGRSPHVPPKPLAADGISADFLWDSVPSTAPISSLSSGPSVHRSHIFTSRAALAWTWGSDGSVVRVISGLDGRGSPAGHTDKGCS